MTHHSKIYIPLIGLFSILFSLPCIAENSITITLEQALEIAQKNSPALASSRFSVDAAREGEYQVEAALYPQVNASADLSVSGSGNSTSASVTVSQYITDFGKTTAQVASARQSVFLSEQNLDTTRYTLIRDVKQAYFEVLRKRHLVSVAEESLEVSQQQLQQAKALYKQGLRPKIDVTRAEVQVSQARLALSTNNYNLTKAKITFERHIGGKPAAGNYRLRDVENSALYQTPLEDLIKQATSNRSELAVLNTQLKIKENAIKVIESSAYPSLKASGAFILNPGGAAAQSSVWQIGVGLTWPIFTGYRQTHQATESRIDLENTRAQLQNRRLLIMEEVTQAYYQVKMSEESISNAETALRQAKENLEIAQGRYKAGISNAIELSDARVLYAESRSSLVQATFDKQKALAQLEFAAGGSLTP